MLDVLTERGQQSVQHERDAVMLFIGANPSFGWIATPKGRPADIDGFIVRGTEIAAAVEVKARNMRLVDFERRFDSAWLVSVDKLIRGRAIAQSHSVPLVGFLYLVPDRTLLVKRLCECDGMLAVSFRCENTVTQRTVNGGIALRSNAYIDMSNAKVIR